MHLCPNMLSIATLLLLEFEFDSTNARVSSSTYFNLVLLWVQTKQYIFLN